MSSSSDPSANPSQEAAQNPPYYLLDARGRHICTLCKRKLPTYEKVLEHFRLSKLHIDNLEDKNNRDADERERRERQQRKGKSGDIVDAAVGTSPELAAFASVADTSIFNTGDSAVAMAATAAAASSSGTGTGQTPRARKRKHDKGDDASSSLSPTGRSKSNSPTKSRKSAKMASSSSAGAIAEQAATNLGLKLPPRPKNPVKSPYIYYAKDNRHAFVTSHGTGMAQHDISRGLGASWRDLPEDEKEPYRERVRVENEANEREMEQYGEAMEEFKAASPQWQIENNRLLLQQESREHAAAAASADIEIHRAWGTSTGSSRHVSASPNIHGSKRKSPKDLEERAARHLGMTLPKKPTKPVSSFFYYQNEHRGRVMKGNRGLMVGQVAKIIGNMWKSVSVAEKAKYKELARRSKREHGEAMTRYNRERDAFMAANPRWTGEYNRLVWESRPDTVATEDPRVATASSPSREREAEVLPPHTATSSTFSANKDDPSNKKHESKNNNRKTLYIQPADEWSASSSDPSLPFPPARPPEVCTNDDADSSVIVEEESESESESESEPESSVSHAMTIEGSSELIQSLKDGTKSFDPHYLAVLNSVEIVLASKDDVAHKRSSRSRYREGSVGFRCIHCKDLPRSTRARSAVNFPRSISNLRITFSNFYPHFKVCSQIDAALRLRLLSKERQVSPLHVSFPSYCTEAAKSLGIEQDPAGTIRFSDSIPRGQEPTSFLLFGTSSAGSEDHSNCSSPPRHLQGDTTDASQSQRQTESSLLSPADALRRAIAEANANPSPLLRADERLHTTDYMYLILNHLCVCTLTDSLKKGKRKDMPLGMAGMSCKRCNRAYFYSNNSCLAAAIRNRMYPHLLGCCAEASQKALRHAETIRESQVVERNLTEDRSPSVFLDVVFTRLMSRGAPLMNHGGSSSSQPNSLSASRSDACTNPSDNGNAQDLICVHCTKYFSSSNGLKYHLQHAVCRRMCADDQKVGQSHASACSKNSGESTCNPDEAVEASPATHQDACSSTSLVIASEKHQTTDFMFKILSQFTPCVMTVEDHKVVGRGHLSLGYPGIKCKHCSKTFFYGPDARFASRIADKLYPHLKDCTCPSSIKKMVAGAESTRELQKQERNLRGDRSPTNFATRVFERMFRQEGTVSNASAPTRDGRPSVSSSGGSPEAASPQPQPPQHRLMMSGGPFSRATSPDTPVIDASVARDNDSAAMFDREMAIANARSNYLFDASDRHTTTDFNYLVIRQFVLCHRSTEEKKSRYPSGFPGISCVYCSARMYFPDSKSMMKQFNQRIHQHLNDKCPGCSHGLKVAIAFAQRRRESQKKQLGESGSLKKFCDQVLGKMLNDANMLPLPELVLRPRSPSSGVATATSARQMTNTEMSSLWTSSGDEGDEHVNLSSADQDAIKRVMDEAHDLPCAYISKKDRALTSDYNYVVFKQFELVTLTEEDFIKNREKYEVGFPGFQCRHCPKTFYFRDADLFGKLFIQNLGGHLKCCVSASESSDLQVALSHLKNTHASQVRRAAISGRDLYRLIYGRLCKAAGKNVPMEFLTPPPRTTIRDRGASMGSRASGLAGPLFPDAPEDENDKEVTSTSVAPPLITTMDRELATDYHYMLLSQYGTVSLSRKDKSKGGCFAQISIGQSGVICRHCKTTKLFFRSGDGFKNRIFSKTKDHIKSCPSIPENVRQKLLSWDWPHVQRQLRTIEGGNQSLLLQRLWMRLNHEWSRSREIDARARPLFQDDSDVDLFCSSSSDESSDVEDGPVRERFSSTTSFSSPGSRDDDDATSDPVEPPAAAVAAQGPTPSSPTHLSHQTTGSSEFKRDRNESQHNTFVPGTVTNDLTCYTTLAWESISEVADKLGCGWRAVAEANIDRYPSLRVSPHRATFQQGSILMIPPRDCDFAVLLQLCRMSDDALLSAKSDGSEPAAAKTAANPSVDAQHVPAGEGRDANGSPNDTVVKSDISFDKFVTCAMGMTNDFRLDLGMFVDSKFRAVVQALVGGGNEGRKESLVSLLTNGVHDAALGNIAMQYDGPLMSSAFEESETDTKSLTEALAVFSRSRGGIFSLCENKHFIAYAKSAAPHCKLPTALEVMQCW